MGNTYFTGNTSLPSPSKTTVAKYTELLEGTYSKANLLGILRTLKPMFEGSGSTIGDVPVARQIALAEKKFTSTKKTELASLAALILSHPATRTSVFEAMDSKVAMVLRTAVSQICMGAMQIRSIMGMKAPKAEYRWRYDSCDEIKEILGWMVQLENYPSGNDVYFVIPGSMYALLRNHFAPPAPALSTFLPLPDKEGQVVFSAEAETLGLIPVLQGLHQNGTISPGAKRVAVSEVNKACKLLKAAELFPDNDDKNVRQLRTTLLVNFFESYMGVYSSKPRPTQPYELIKQALKTVNSASSYMCRFIPATLFKGVLSRESNSWDMSTLLKGVVDALQHFTHGDHWISPKAIIARIAQSQAYYSLMMFSPCDMTRTTATNTLTGNTLTPDNLVKQAGVPVLLQYLAMLASAGVAELAYLPAEYDSPSPLWKLQGVRLTGLGKWALGLTDQYTPPKADVQKLFELSENRLLVRAIGDNNPYEGLLNDFARPIGGRRYVVTPGLFLGSCKNPGEISQRIESFKRTFTDGEVPANWQEFFGRMMRATNGVSPDRNSYTVLQLDDTDPELLQAVTTDPRLRECTVRAEGHRLLVPHTELQKFKTRMLEYGYIV